MSSAVTPLSSHLRRGVLAAVVTPVDEHGTPDLCALAEIIDFVQDRGVDGIVVGGATGEYSNFSLDQRRALVEEGARRASPEFAVVAGIGAQTLQQTLFLAEAAADAGCRAVLLPMPYFFHYAQDDLVEYSRAVCQAAAIPCLLYHLPAFAGALSIDNIIELLASGASFAGMKDSSGAFENLGPLADAAKRRSFDLFAGDDSVALAALTAGWDGVISGIACFVPELLVALLDSFRAGDMQTAKRLQEDLDRVINEVVKLPIPWAVRLGLEARGISPGPLPLPLSPSRREQTAAFHQWFSDWIRAKDWMQPSRRAMV